MILLSWNIRGLNDPNKIKEVKNYIVSNLICLVGLFETRVKEDNEKKIQRKFGTNWEWVSNYEHHRKGRIWVGWRQDQCQVDIIRKHTQFITVKMLTQAHGSFNVVFIYGLHTVTDRRDLWVRLRTLDNQRPLLFIGDYNAIYKVDHRQGTQATTYELNDMHNWMIDMNLHALKEVGHEFSWSNGNEGDNRIKSKIDHAICNLPWMQSFAAIPVLYDNAKTSDHCPLLLKLSHPPSGTRKPFKFLNYLTDHPDFLQRTEKAWNIEVSGHGTEKIWRKL